MPPTDRSPADTMSVFHTQALGHAHMLLRAAGSPVLVSLDTARTNVAEWFEHDGDPHLTRVEHSLLPLLDGRNERDADIAERMRADHVQLRELVSSLDAASADDEDGYRATAKRLASALEEHQRFEERQLLQHLTRTASADELATAASELAR